MENIRNSSRSSDRTGAHDTFSTDPSAETVIYFYLRSVYVRMSTFINGNVVLMVWSALPQKPKVGYLARSVTFDILYGMTILYYSSDQIPYPLSDSGIDSRLYLPRRRLSMMVAPTSRSFSNYFLMNYAESRMICAARIVCAVFTINQVVTSFRIVYCWYLGGFRYLFI